MFGVSGYLKTPLTDLAGSILTHQHHGRCKEMEMKAINCLEAYGFKQGKEKCNDIYTDFKECAYRFKQEARLAAIMKEREKQNVYEPPPREDIY